MDKWVLSKLQSLVKFVDEGLADYRITETARAIAAFVDELSQLVCAPLPRALLGQGPGGRQAGRVRTLYTVLTTLCGLCAPYIPFMTENMYQNLVVNNIPGARESVHLTDFPKADMALVDKALEDDMEAVIAIVQLGRACRSAANMKVRQPARVLYVKGANLPEAMAALIADELNVKRVEFVSDARAFTSYKIKPQLRTLGPRYGKLLGKISAYLAQADDNDVVDTFDRGEALTFDVDGVTVELSREDTLIEPMQKPGFMAESEGDLTVVLDTNPHPGTDRGGLRTRGRLQSADHAQGGGYEVTDRIFVTCEGGREAFRHRRPRRSGHPPRRAGRGARAFRPPADRRLRQGVEHQRRKGRAFHAKSHRVITPRRRAPRLFGAGRAFAPTGVRRRKRSPSRRPESLPAIRRRSFAAWAGTPAGAFRPESLPQSAA